MTESEAVCTALYTGTSTGRREAGRKRQKAVPDQREERGGAAAHDDERCAAGQERERGAVDREQHDLQRHDETSTRPGETASLTYGGDLVNRGRGRRAAAR